ncbi:hypothetical protein SBRCBS47491_005185 [Sporothrix bragantina]|uniref:Zeta toxin domain-containing protein n=1 Tax=Sporothrix bragantina TaxID=671064 RepID=A0ABP0BWK7_9PEZI
MPPKPSDYFLSDADNAAIFEQQIRPAEFGQQKDEELAIATEGNAKARPVCIILAGQTGAGKSHAAPALVAALNKIAASSSPLCHLVADTHKPYHPAYAGLVADAAAGRAPPGLASAATGHDARRWLARSCAVAAAQRRTALVESASRYPQDVVEMATTFQTQGYRVCLVLLGVHAAQSRLGLLARFLEASTSLADKNKIEDTENRRPKMPVRLTPRSIHDESFVGLASLAKMLDAQGSGSAPGQQDKEKILADEVLILRRGNQVAYANHWQQATRSWQTTPPGVSQALAAERARRWTSKESHDGQDSQVNVTSPLAKETALFASDVARLRAAHPDRADELDALTAEYEATIVSEDGETGGGKEAEYCPLNPDALVAHLQSNQW